MPPRGIRFHPPPVEAPAELGWVLARAFGPPERTVEAPADPRRAVEVARGIEVSARLAARLPRERWEEELGAAAGELRRERIGAVATEVRLMDVAREVAEEAAAMGVPVALLKGAALIASGAAPTGGRLACDVDLLAPEAGARALHAVLRGRGWTASEVPSGDHQLGALASKTGGVVELHLHLPGVRIGGRSARFEDLEREGLLEDLEGWPARRPKREVLAAHAIAHAIAQHGFAPDACGLMKMEGDLIDLGFGGGGEAMRGRVMELVRADVSGAEVEAARGLASALAAGEEVVEGLAREGEQAGEMVLLRHLVAGRWDERYRASLKLRLRAQPGDRSRTAAAVKVAWDALFLSRAQVDAIYGRPANGWGYLGRRLARPFDLARRLAGYAATARGRKPAAHAGEKPAPHILPPP